MFNHISIFLLYNSETVLETAPFIYCTGGIFMSIQTVFKRYELKYMLTEQQKEKVLQAMEPYMALDQYGRTVIRSIYFDTDNYRLIRRSIEKPAYKEKLRIRSYSQAEPGSPVFVELKKKYKKIVYKRRISLPELEAMEWIQGTRQCPKECQIAREINDFLEYYDALYPAVFLSCEREAFACICEDHKYVQPVSAYLPCNPSRHRKGKRND